MNKNLKEKLINVMRKKRTSDILLIVSSILLVLVLVLTWGFHYPLRSLFTIVLLVLILLFLSRCCDAVSKRDKEVVLRNNLITTILSHEGIWDSICITFFCILISIFKSEIAQLIVVILYAIVLFTIPKRISKFFEKKLK